MHLTPALPPPSSLLPLLHSRIPPLVVAAAVVEIATRWRASLPAGHHGSRLGYYRPDPLADSRLDQVGTVDSQSKNPLMRAFVLNDERLEGRQATTL